MNEFNGKNILITGGLGFIGSNLALKLVELGANVTIVDVLDESYGGNLFNIEPIKEKINLKICNILDKDVIESLVAGKDYIFHLASQVDHTLGQTDPYKDIEYNIVGTVILLEACRKKNKNAKIIYTGTRGEYGEVSSLPATENALTNPKGMYEITKLTAGKILNFYSNIHSIRSVVTRLSNVYGPRGQMKSNKFCVVNWFVRLALEGKPITLYGDGLSKRDFIYVDDAVDALLMLAIKKDTYGEVFNIGHSEVFNFSRVADMVVEISGKGSIVKLPVPDDRKKQEPGDYYPDLSKIERYVNWKPKTSFKEGLIETIDFYVKNHQYYW